MTRSRYVRIIYEGAPLDCEYEYEPAYDGDATCPPQSEEFEVIEAVNPEGIDVIDTLTISERMYINQLAIYELEKGLEP